MNIILLRKDDSIKGGRVILTDYRAKHIVKVLGSRVGDILRVGRINGRMGQGSVLALKRKFPFAVEIDVTLDCDPPPKSPIDLILALPRPIMLRRIFSQAASLGVENIHILHARRVEKSFWDAGLIDESEYNEHLIHGLEQAVDTVLPRVVFHRRFKPFIEDYLPEIENNYDNLLLAHPRHRKKVSEIIDSAEGKTLVAIGPEGGWVDYEETKFESASFRGFTLGERILKVDTAVINIHGRIMAILEGIK